MTPIQLVFLILLAICLILLVIVLIISLKKKDKSDTSFQLQQVQDQLKQTLDYYQIQVSSLLKSTFDNLASLQREALNQMGASLQTSLNTLSKNLEGEKDQTSHYLDQIKTALYNSLNSLQKDNSTKLDQMRQLVEEKMQETLNTRITASFKEVRDGINSVLGVVKQMESVSNDVTSLSKVLTNVKTKGIMGEVELGNILMDILAPEQYSTNVSTKKNSGFYVEYAIKMPGKGQDTCYLPIDSKFPLEKYRALLNAYDSSDSALVEKAKKDLRNQIKDEAKDIQQKYLDVPYTTDFGVLFLPSEGLYAEVMNLDEIYQIQNENHIMIAGPSNMAALVNSLQMGFKTLAIEKNSKQIGVVLMEVKNEFDKYQIAVEEVNKKLAEASTSMDKVVGVRTRAIVKKLSKVESLEDKEEIKDEG